MGFFNALFGGRQLSPEEERQEQEAKKFDLLKYDGVKAMKMGQADYAVRCFGEALKLHDDLEVHDYLSQVFMRQGQLDEAAAELRTLAAAEPGNAQIWMRLAQVAYMQEDYAAMGIACAQALQAEPQNAQAHYLNAQAQLGIRGEAGQVNVVSAIAMLTKAIALEPDYADAYLLRGQTLLAAGDTASADADAEWLVQHVGDQEDVLLFKARVETARGNREAAITIYNKVVEVNPFSIDAFRERGRLRLEAGDKDGARQDMETVLELDPQQLADVSGEYSAEGVEQRVRQAYSAANPLGL